VLGGRAEWSGWIVAVCDRVAAFRARKNRIDRAHPSEIGDLTIRQFLNPSQRWIRNSVGSGLERMCEEGFKSTSRSPAWWGRFFGSEIFASRPGAFTLPRLSSSPLSNN
jgi:hypothetical protein